MTQFTSQRPPHLLPEWHRQSAVLLTWPHPHSDWADQLAETESVYLQLTQAISRFQLAVIICYDANHRLDVKQRLSGSGISLDKVALVCFESNDTWIRDYGPLSAGNTLLDFRFNGWGGKFGHDKDDRISSCLHRSGLFDAAPLHRINQVLEGGSIETDGAGTLLTTSSCLLSPTRNPDLDRAATETMLENELGVDRILWLEHGALEGDDTDGHIDMLARFCDEKTIAYTACDEPGYVCFQSLGRMELELKAMRTKSGEPYRLLPLPWPGPKFGVAGERLPASYANFLIVNGAVLVPTYDDPADEEALRIIQSGFPDRDIIGIPCLPLIRQNGSLHCITMQIPDSISITPS